MKRLLEPAFDEKNTFLSLWMLVGLILFIVIFGGMQIVPLDPPKELAVADAKLRDAAFKRMAEACFTPSEIKNYWYHQGFWKHPSRLLIIIRGREKLCGGRGLCGCESPEEDKVSKGSV